MTAISSDPVKGHMKPSRQTGGATWYPGQSAERPSGSLGRTRAALALKTSGQSQEGGGTRPGWATLASLS